MAHTLKNDDDALVPFILKHAVCFKGKKREAQNLTLEFVGGGGG
jgi:hypothetical protein